MPKPVDPEKYPILISLINETYRDEVETIVSAREEDNGDLLVVALDGTKQLAIKITDEEILIRLLNPEQIDPQPVNLSDPLPSFAEQSNPLDGVESFAERLRKQAAPILNGWIDQIEAALNASTDLAEFASSLPELYPDLPVEEFRALLLDATVAAELAGRFEAQEEG